MGAQYIGESADFPAGKGVAVTVGERKLAVFRTSDGLGCIDAVCPHQGGDLSQGVLGGDRCVTCPVHAMRYNVLTGVGTEESVPAYRIWEEDGKVYVDTTAGAASKSLDDALDEW